jgi:EAL domain-containing protein (putative c-di-GMP-specific phosphodiesterase class I)/sensor domain CHASE-containing protein
MAAGVRHVACVVVCIAAMLHTSAPDAVVPAGPIDMTTSSPWPVSLNSAVAPAARHGAQEVGAVIIVIALTARVRVVALVIAALASISVPMPWPAPEPIEQIRASAVDAAPAARALEAVRKAWDDELDELSASVRALAVADDAYDFVARPNIPYVRDVYTPERLAAERIDTVLIIDRTGKPLFWRRVNDRHNRGFPDAEVFLAQLPRLSAPNVPNMPGRPTLAGAVRLARGPSLVVAMPICPVSRTAPARGWLIAARALDDAQWRRYGERAHVVVDALDPGSSEWPSAAASVPTKPLVPTLRAVSIGSRAWLPLYDIKGQRLRLLRVTVASPIAPIAPPAARGRSSWLWSVPLIAGLVGALLLRIRRRQGAVRLVAALPRRAVTIERPEAPAIVRAPAPARDAPDAASLAMMALGTVPVPEEPGAAELITAIDPVDLALPVTESGAKQTPAKCTCAEVPALPPAPFVAQDGDSLWGRHLCERLPAATCGVLYQPQVDLHSDRIEGVEAILCTAEDGGRRPVREMLAEAEALALEATERCLREACRERQAWFRDIHREFPVSVPVSQHALEDPVFLPVLKRALEDCGLAPRYLELAVTEAAITDSATALRALEQAHRAGVLICIDHFGNGPSSLRWLAVLQISKVRIDAALVREAAHNPIASAFVRTVLNAARALRIAVCATGIDSGEQLVALAAYGRLLAQGDSIAPPMKGERLLATLRCGDDDTAQLPILVIDEPRRDERELTERT